MQSVFYGAGNMCDMRCEMRREMHIYELNTKPYNIH